MCIDPGPALDALSRVEVLLVASDYDGTIAPIVAHPAMARAHGGAAQSLHDLAALPRTHVAIVSGRCLADLRERTSAIADAHLVGSHGSEIGGDAAISLSFEESALLERLADFLRGLAQASSGFVIEEKPTSITLHCRQADASKAQWAIDAIRQGPQQWPGVYVRSGKKVIELCVVEANKGSALLRLRQRLHPSATLFIGDDDTDEDAFAVLGAGDLGIKVGPGPSAARYRCADCREVALLLARLARARDQEISTRGYSATHLS